MKKSLFLSAIFSCLVAVIPVFYGTAVAGRSPSLKDIHEGNYDKGPYTVYTIQKFRDYPDAVELFLYPAGAKERIDLLVLTYQDKGSDWNRFKAGEKVEITFRYEGNGRYSVAFVRLDSALKKKEELCCFKNAFLQAVSELYLSY